MSDTSSQRIKIITGNHYGKLARVVSMADNGYMKARIESGQEGAGQLVSLTHTEWEIAAEEEEHEEELPVTKRSLLTEGNMFLIGFVIFVIVLLMGSLMKNEPKAAEVSSTTQNIISNELLIAKELDLQRAARDSIRESVERVKALEKAQQALRQEQIEKSQ